MDSPALLLSAVIWAIWTLSILVFVVWEIFDARREWQTITELGINGMMRRTSTYVRRAAYADLAQVICFVLVVVLALAGDKAYGVLGPTADLIYRNIVRGALIVSLVPMFLRVRERYKLRADMREDDS